MKLFIERIVTILLIFTFIIFFANQNDAQASQSTYQINTTDRYTLTGSIVDIIDKGSLISPEHYSKFYLALKEIEYNETPSLSPSAILKRYGIPYMSSSSYTNRILSRSTWKYPNFEEIDNNYIYTGGFDDESEKKWISIEYSQVISGFVSMGTFNFSSGLLHLPNHYIFDVYPYLIWGNLFTDNSNVRERFIWDKDSLSQSAALYAFRGENLYSHTDSNIGNLSSVGYFSKNAIIDRIDQQLSWDFGGFCGRPPNNPIICGGIGQPPCAIINTDFLNE